MPLSDEVKACVCFLCVYHGGGNYTPYATAFFIGAPYLSQGGKYHYYLVTARHNLDGLEAEHKKRGIHIRYNNDEGKGEYLALTDEWEFPHKKGTADVAVLPLEQSQLPGSVDAIRLDYCVTDRFLGEKLPGHENDATYFAMPDVLLYIGAGDDVFIVGLFTHRKGNYKNIPIVRSGIIAANPEGELIYDQYRNQWYTAYLIEVRSIGGLSGSPVFISVNRERAAQTGMLLDTYPPERTKVLFLIGLVRGHWSLSDEDLPHILKQAKKATKKPKTLSDSVDRLNTGIAAVTPFSEVLMILRRECLVKRRQEKEQKELSKAAGLTLDSGPI